MSLNKINQERSASNLEVFSTVVLIILAITNVKNPINMILLLIGTIGWFFSLFNRYSNLYVFDKKIVQSVFGIIVLSLFYIIAGISDYEIIGTFTFRLMCWGMLTFSSVYFLRICSKRQALFITAIIIITLMYSMYQCFVQGRQLIVIGMQDEASELGAARISSSYMLFSIICFVFFLHVKQKWLKILAMSFIVLSIFINFFILQRATNVIFTIIAFGFVLIFNFHQSKFIKFLLLLLCAGVFVIFETELYIPFLDWFASLMPDRVAERINDINIALQYQDLSVDERSSLGARNNLLTNSIHTFFSSPVSFIFGVGEHPHQYDVIGNHSYVLDQLARYGIIGGIILYALFRNEYYFLKSFVDPSDNPVLFKQTMVIFGAYMFRNVYGNVNFDCVVVQIMLLLPLLLTILQSQKEKI